MSLRNLALISYAPIDSQSEGMKILQNHAYKSETKLLIDSFGSLRHHVAWILQKRPDMTTAATICSQVAEDTSMKTRLKILNAYVTYSHATPMWASRYILCPPSHYVLWHTLLCHSRAICSTVVEPLLQHAVGPHNSTR